MAASRLIMGCAVFIALCSPVLASKTCVIVVAVDRPSSAEIYRHELAHCNGWDHPDHKGKPKKGYQSPQPPQKFIRPYAGKLVDHYVSTREALKLCGSYGCQWFE